VRGIAVHIAAGAGSGLTLRTPAIRVKVDLDRWHLSSDGQERDDAGRVEGVAT
jgi:hypothetical protein